MILGFMDPYLLVCPPQLESEDVIVAYVQRLVAWYDLKNEAWFSIVLSRTASELLADTNGFPPWDRISSALEREDIGIQASDVSQIMYSLLGKSATIEDLAGIEDILWDDVACDPAHYLARGEANKYHFERLLGLIGLFRRSQDSDLWNGQLLTADTPCPENIDFSASILEIEPLFTTAGIYALPVQVRHRMLSVCCPAVAIREADSLRIWQSSTDASDLHAAISLRAQQLGRERDMAVPPWRLGQNFAASVIAIQHGNQNVGPKILRACCETIFDENLVAVHAIRESGGGSSEQLRRGNDRAYRRDIDRELHLHYWNTNGGPELASVVHHSEMSIPD